MKAYIIGDREHFEWTDAAGNKIEKDFALTQSLLDFLDVDLDAAGALFDSLWKGIQSLYPYRREEPMEVCQLLELFEQAGRLHIYFEFMHLDWRQRLQRYAAGECRNVRDELNYKDVSHMYAAAVGWQTHIRYLLERVLVAGAPKGSIQPKLASLYGRKDLSDLDRFAFEPMPVKLERVSDSVFTDVLRPGRVQDLVSFFLSEIIRREITFKTCRCCGRYFPSYVHGNAEYCERVFQGGKTCKEIGAISMFRAKVEESPAMKLYQRAYKTRFARIKAGKISKEQFAVWGEEARAYRDRVMSGEMELEAFEGWLRKS